MFNIIKEFVIVCPDCDNVLTTDDFFDGYDSIVCCSNCGLKIYVGCDK